MSNIKKKKKLRGHNSEIELEEVDDSLMVKSFRPKIEPKSTITLKKLSRKPQADINAE